MLSSGLEVFLIIQGMKAPVIGKKDLRTYLVVMLVERTNEKPIKVESVLEKLCNGALHFLQKTFERACRY
jgi:hypothetical protein